MLAWCLRHVVDAQRGGVVHHRGAVPGVRAAEREPGAGANHARASAALSVSLVQIYARLQQCSAVPDFNNYLAFLLSQASVRPVASLREAPSHSSA